MIIKDKRELIRLSEISNGAVFGHENGVYMRVFGYEIMESKRMVVNLETGKIRYFDYDILVEPLDAEIIINR